MPNSNSSFEAVLYRLRPSLDAGRWVRCIVRVSRLPQPSTSSLLGTQPFHSSGELSPSSCKIMGRTAGPTAEIVERHAGDACRSRTLDTPWPAKLASLPPSLPTPLAARRRHATHRRLPTLHKVGCLLTQPPPYASMPDGGGSGGGGGAQAEQQCVPGMQVSTPARGQVGLCPHCCTSKGAV